MRGRKKEKKKKVRERNKKTKKGFFLGTRRTRFNQEAVCIGRCIAHKQTNKQTNKQQECLSIGTHSRSHPIVCMLIGAVVVGLYHFRFSTLSQISVTWHTTVSGFFDKRSGGGVTFHRMSWFSRKFKQTDWVLTCSSICFRLNSPLTTEQIYLKKEIKA